MTENPPKARAIVYPHAVAWLKHVTKTLRPARVLEQGAGAGQYAGLFSPQSYFSIDVPETWYTMERRPSAYASAAALPFPDDCFDLVFSVAAFDYFPEPQQVLKETARVLRRSGIGLIFTYDRATLERIHENCRALSYNRAAAGHHVFDKRELVSLASAAGLHCRAMPFVPERGLLLRLRHLVSPDYHRVFRLKHAAA